MLEDRSVNLSLLMEENEFKLLLSCPSGLSPLQVSVNFHDSYDRVPHPDIGLENSISQIFMCEVFVDSSKDEHHICLKNDFSQLVITDEEYVNCITIHNNLLEQKLDKQQTFLVIENVSVDREEDASPSNTWTSFFANKYIWDQRVQQSTSLLLFNGKKFRFGGHSGVEPHVCLHLGLTDYRTFVGTNLNPLWERFLVPSEDDCKQCQHTSSPLGNGAVVETFDNKIILLQRSNNVGEFPGYLVFPGGHPEPEEVCITSHKCEYGLQNSEMTNSRVSREMFDSIVREVVEEIGVPAATLSDPLFIGISRRVLNVRPAAFFFIKCNLQSTEVQQHYSSAQDGYESTKLYTIQLSELENMASKMPGCHRGGFELYKLLLEDGKNI